MAKAQTDHKIRSVQNIVDGAFSYPSYNSKKEFYVAQKKVDSFFQLFRIEYNGTAVQITSDSADNTHASISSNGRWLAYTKQVNNKRDIFLFDVNEGKHINLTQTPDFSESHPSWALSDSLVVFNTTEYAQTQEISAIRLHDKKKWRMTKDSEEDTYGSISPDGKKLVYTKWLNEQKDAEIYILLLSDGIENRVTNNTFRDVAPVWLSDSVISYSQNGSIIIHDLHTNYQRRLTTDGEFRFGRGIPVGKAALLCERMKERKADGLSVIFF